MLTALGAGQLHMCFVVAVLAVASRPGIDLPVAVERMSGLARAD
jgi:hypothetical protein